MKVLAVQFDIAWEDKPANVAAVRRLLAGHDLRGALVVLPEMFATGFSMNVPRIAEGDDRPAERFCQQLAAEHGCWVLGGVVNRGADGKGRNEAVAFGPDGAELLRYAKLHPFRYAGETDHYTGGQALRRLTIDAAAVVPLICYDLRFPEAFRLAVCRGAEVFAVIANWPASRKQHWTTLLRARAIENQAFVVGVNRCGQDPHLAYAGRSLIVDPRGTVLADGANGETVLTAELDLADQAAYRAAFPVLADVRREFLQRCQDLWNTDSSDRPACG